MASLRGVASKPAPDRVAFSIPHLLPLPNATNGKHWAAGHAYRKRLLPMVAAYAHLWAGCVPMERARITIVRHSTGEPDEDNLRASVKPLIDLLLVLSKTHPHSLGLVVDDTRWRVEQVVASVRVSKRAEQRTEVIVERLPGLLTNGVMQ